MTMFEVSTDGKEQTRKNFQKNLKTILKNIDYIKKGCPIEAEENNDRKADWISRATGIKVNKSLDIVRNKQGVVKGLPKQKKQLLKSMFDADLVDIIFLDLALSASKSIAKIRYNSGSTKKPDQRYAGTGFMISNDLFLTNNHAILDNAELSRYTIEFNYEYCLHYKCKQSTTYKVIPKILVSSPEKKLDFTLLRVNNNLKNNQPPLINQGFCPLSPKEITYSNGERVNIIQHPEGERKKIAMRDNYLLDNPGDKLQYCTDTKHGSSGSPIFNDQFEVIGLHHYGLSVTEIEGLGKITPRSGESEWPLRLNEGIKINLIYKAIKKAIENPKKFSKKELELIKTALKLKKKKSRISNLE